MAALNTHTYDAKWKKELDSALALDDKFFTNTGEINEINDIINLSNLSTNIKRQAQNWRSQIINGHGNKDSANNVDAYEILRRIERVIHYRLHVCLDIESKSIEDIDNICSMYKIPKTGDILDFDDNSKYPIVVNHMDLESVLHEANISLINAYVEQLAEVQNGACPQGRTTRLFQIYTTFYSS